jgi:hypothetical protein
METIHERREALPPLAGALAAFVQGGIDPRVKAKHRASEPLAPTGVLKIIEHDSSLTRALLLKSLSHSQSA